MKQVYQTPQVELYEFTFEGTLLNNSVNSVETMTSVNGSWDDETE